MELKFNKYQTPVTDSLLDSLNEEVKDQLIDFLSNVEYIKRLVSPERKRAKDLERDSLGRIIVDIANPHILENMDYFRPSALHFMKYGVYTFLRPNANPNSEYGKWIREERRRCWEGYVRPTDGEWVPGALYFYLNYCRIVLTKIRKGTKKADRVVDFPEMWEGIYLRFHYLEQARNGGKYNNFEGGNNGAELSSRSKSKSYSLASIMGRNFVLGENSLACKQITSIVTAYQKEYLTKDGILNKFVSIINFCSENTQFPRRRLKDSIQEMTWTMGYRDAELNIDRGSLNTVIGVSSKDDESKIRGKRASFIGIEEFGSFPRLLDLYNVLIPSVQEGDIVYGLMYLEGTAGDNDSDFAGAQEIMYSPRGYNMYALPNVFDKNSQGKNEFVFFFPGYLNRKGCYNEDGVSDVTKALIEILQNRFRVKYNSTDPNTVLKTMAEIPVTPTEAIMKTGVNMFPVTDLNERISQIDTDSRFYDDTYTGDLILDKDGNVAFSPTSKFPIREFPHKDNKIEGCIEIFQMPEKNKDGEVFPNRYILGCDPYDDDASNTMSLGSIFCLDLWTDRLVAEYTGRPMFADGFFEICRKMCIFYNGRLNYENNKKGLFAYFAQNNCLYLLTETLEFLRDKQVIKETLYGNKSRGTNATEAVNNYGRERLRSWLIRPVQITVTNDGKEDQITVPNLYLIKNRALLKELVLWNSAGNFDRVSAMGMLMLLREDKIISVQGQGNLKPKDTETTGYLGNDSFFTCNYDRKLEAARYKGIPNKVS